jgi:glycogen(starch) synthase
MVIVTETPGPSDGFPFRVVRQPGPGVLLRWVRWCEVYFHNSVSLRAAWPLLLVRRPWVVVHHT